MLGRINGKKKKLNNFLPGVHGKCRFSLQNLGKFGTNTMQEHSARIHANDTSRNDYQSLDDGDEDWSSKCSRCFQIFKSLRIEPVMFLFMFSFILNSTCLTNMIMEKGCLYYLNYSKEICSNLSYYKDQRDSVEILANNYNLYLDMLAPIGATVVIFLAPWSDKYGRKPPLILALFGFFVNDVGIILCTIYFYSALEYIILSSLATQLTGGFIAVMTVIYSHSSEVSSAASRSQKYTYLQIAFGIAVTLGALAGGQLYRYYGYTVVYSTMASGHLMAILWVIIFVPETAGLDSNVSFWHKMRDLCSSQNFTSGFKSTLKHRDNNGRTRLWFLLLSSCTVAITYEVFTNINYVYAHHMYGWDPAIYSEMWTIFSFSEMIVVLGCTSLFIQVFKLTDPVLGIIGSVSIIGKNIFIALAYELWLYYLSNIFGFLNGLANLAVRSLISKLVDKEELGRVFSFLATCEAIVPLMASGIIAKVFNATIRTFPGACFLVATVFLMLPLGTFVWQLKYRVPREDSALKEA
ncbi:proton-coupled folate transporter-like isoform X2 [Stegodyphus dumicola]|uniref:proton-coupled folate transporter-like isoform X2 n=1 Tax=Stegodyphus dumicola TaxID=202533 RepID=UPI0015B0FBFE|nr:proton-coupled folate transporter-like isoform X2 [Stegodyphus dumicola]